MELHSIRHYGKYYASEDIKEGDIVSVIYKNKIRKSKPSDLKMIGISMEDYKTGEEVRAITTSAEIEI